MLSSIFLIDRCLIKLYLSLKCLSRMEIHSNLTETLGAEAVVYSTTTRYLHRQTLPILLKWKRIKIDTVHSLKSMK
jgi:hypothetical protein